MFVSRTRELAALEKLWKKDAFQMVVMYGRRRIGKTTLISNFVQGKRAIFFSAQETNAHLNLQLFSAQVYAFFGLPDSTGPFVNWNNAFDFIAERAAQERFVLAIDEFPYLAEADKAIPSILQNVIDHKLKNSGLYLILCGSQISFMENEVLGYKSPLFGRRTAQMRLEGFDYYDAAQMLPGMSDEDKIKTYACVGGTPHYLAQMDLSLSFEENIRELYFSPNGYLYSEPSMLLQQELREPAMYNSIISAIAGGASRMNEITTKIHEDNSKTAKYLKTLLDLHILNKSCPFGENPDRSRKSIYSIEDHCYRFWYRYVFFHRAGIETGGGDAIADSLVFPELSAFIGKPAFEQACQSYLIRCNNNRALPFLATSFGAWWGTDSATKKSADIDLIAANTQNGEILLGECKWRNEPTDAGEVQKLLEKATLLPGYDAYHFVFFTKSSYSPAAKALQKSNPTLHLVSLGDIFATQPGLV